MSVEVLPEPVPSLGRVLVVDDEVNLMEALCERLNAQGYLAVGSAAGPAALKALRQEDFDLLLTDLMMPGMDGIALLKASLEIDPHLVGIVMTGQGTIENAVEAMKLGAFDYLLKPFKMHELLPVLSRAMDVRRLRLENVELRQTAAVYDLTAMVAFTLDLDLILDKTAETALLQCQADEVSILLPAQEGDEFYVAMVSGEGREHLLGERVPMDQGIAGWVARHQEPLLLCGAVADPRFAPLNPRAEIQVAASLPMVVGGKLVGVLNLNALQRYRTFTPGEMKALRLLTSIASAALESAALYEQARQAEGKYRSIFEQAMEGIFQTTPEGRILSANPALAQMLGYETPEEMTAIVADIGQQLYVEPGQHAEFKRRIEAEGEVKGFETQMWHRDGRKIWVSMSARGVRDAGGRALYYEGLVEDISARKRRELEGQALARVREQVWRMRRPEDMDRVLAGMKEGLLVAEIPFGVCGINLIAEAGGAAGVRSRSMSWQGQWSTPETNEGQDLMLQFWRSGVPAYRRDLHQEDLYGERERLEIGFEYPVRSVLDLPFSHGTLAFNSAQPNAFSEQDIDFLQNLCAVLAEGFQRLDDLKALALSEAQLHRAQRLESLGRLAGGVAHDFNNLITVIDGYSRLLLKNMPAEDARRASVEEIQRAGEMAEALVRQLLAFSRQQPMDPQVLDLNQVVAGVEKMLRRLIREDIKLETSLAPELGKVKADPGQVEQILMNLVVNARDAMPGAGVLRLQTANVEVGPSETRDLGLARPGAYVVLTISDTGTGMSAEVQAQIFEPFFTTKKEGEGTGLGLATVYGIVKRHEGAIQVHSREGEGATFRIYLPRAEDEAGGQAVQSQGLPELPKGKGTILVVEDEPSLRRVVGLILQEQGYTVLIAENGVQALRLSAECRESLDLVLTDVVMPGMNGWELAERLGALRPELPVLYMSGYSEFPDARGKAEGEVRMLRKPFTNQVLILAVRQALESG